MHGSCQPIEDPKRKRVFVLTILEKGTEVPRRKRTGEEEAEIRRGDEKGAEIDQKHLHLQDQRKRRDLAAVRLQEVQEVQEVIAKKKRGAGPGQRWKE